MITEPDKPLRTGLNTHKNRVDSQRRAVGARRVSNPVLNNKMGTGFRNIAVTEKPPFDLHAIRNSYLVDGYISQATDKYVESVTKEGYYLDGPKELVDYLYKRLDMMTLMSKPSVPWQIVIETVVRDFIRYGNTFLAVQRTTTSDPIPGMALKGLRGNSPIGGYFNLPVTQMFPEIGEVGNIINWVQKSSGKEKRFKAEIDCLHFTYRREPGTIWGIPSFISVIEDVRALRQVEESILKLMYKHLNPIIHQETPDITGDGQGRQQDVDDAIRNFQTTAPDGFIVTPPGHKISVIGGENQAIRGEGYWDKFKHRVFAGLGVSDIIMGDGNSSQGTADTITSQMHHRAKTYQSLLSTYFTHYILYELLMEGGYDPWGNEEHRVFWAWNEIEIDRRIKEETHWTNLWTMNAISSEEYRHRMRAKEEMDWENSYVGRVQIPQVIASKSGIDPITGKNYLPAVVPAAGGSSGSRDRSSTAKATKPSKAGTNLVSPSNKTSGPRAKVGAPTAHKMFSMDSTLEEILSDDTVTSAEDIQNKYFYMFPEASLLPMCKQLVEAFNLPDNLKYARINALFYVYAPLIESFLDIMVGEQDA